MRFDKTEASPGDKVSILTKAEPNSVVVLRAIDKSLTLLAEACKSVDSNNVSVIVCQNALTTMIYLHKYGMCIVQQCRMLRYIAS